MPRRIQSAQHPHCNIREIVPVEDDFPIYSFVDENIVINELEEAITLPQVDNPAFEEDFPNNSFVDEDETTAINDQVDNPAVAKRTQDDTGSSSIQRPGSKRARTILGRVAYCNNGFTSLRSMAKIDNIDGQRVIARSQKVVGRF